MANHDRRAAARRRAWGRGPTILRFEPLEGRELLSTSNPLGQIVALGGTSTSTAAAISTGATTSTTSSDATTAANEAATASANAVSTTETNMTGGATSTTAKGTNASAATNSTTAFDGSNLVATSFDTGHNLDWGDTFHAAGSVANVGSTASVKAYEVDVYASSTPKPSSDAVLIGRIAVPAGIAAGSKFDYDQVLTAPPVPLAKLGSAPSYFLIPKLVPQPAANAAASLAPATPTVTGPVLNSVVTITPKVPPKLVGAGLSLSPGSVKWGDTITVTASVHNDSQGSAPPTNARIVLTPVGKQPGGSSDYQIGQVPIPPILGLQTVTASQAITLPSYAPTALANSSQYTVTMIQDADAAVNPLISPTLSTSTKDTTTLTIASPAPTPSAPAKPPAADLTVTDVQEPSPTMFRGATFPVGATIQNNGPGDAGPFKVRFLLVTDESPDAPALVLGDASIPGLAAGMEQDVLQTVTLPYRTPDGFTATSATARIVAQVDPDRAIDQSNTANDTLAAAPVQLKVLTTDGTTTVPVLAGGTAASGANGTTTVTTTPAPSSSSSSNFQTVTVPAASTPTISTPTGTTTTTTTTTTTVPSAPVPASTRAAARQAASQAAAARKAAVAARKEAAAKAAAARKAARAARAARVHAQVISSSARAHSLRLYAPNTSANA